METESLDLTQKEVEVVLAHLRCGEYGNKVGEEKRSRLIKKFESYLKSLKEGF